MPDNRCILLMNRLLPMEKVLAVTPMKKGLTNDSFRVETDGGDYVLRFNGAGTEQLVNRAAEAAVYEVIGAYGFGETVLHISAEGGHKLTRYLPGVRTVHPRCWREVELAMAELRRLHTAELSVAHAYSICEEIRRYERCLQGLRVSPRGGLSVERYAFLQSFVERHGKKPVLTHIDAISDNFLLDAKDRVTLIDWEYAAMADPDWDLAMFAIYAGYEEEDVSHLLALYLRGEETEVSVAYLHKIYAMMALGGYLWGLWSTYKRACGATFHGYEERQYAYAEKYSKKVMDYIGGQDV